jgi:hypothetical protein
LKLLNEYIGMSIQSVIFDVDGVLVFPDRFAEHLTQEHQITQDATQGFFQGKFHNWLLGSADLTELLPPLLKEWGWQGSAEEFMRLWFSVKNAGRGTSENAKSMKRTL